LRRFLAIAIKCGGAPQAFSQFARKRGKYPILILKNISSAFAIAWFALTTNLKRFIQEVDCVKKFIPTSDNGNRSNLHHLMTR
jgi:hypothetical protein